MLLIPKYTSCLLRVVVFSIAPVGLFAQSQKEQEAPASPLLTLAQQGPNASAWVLAPLDRAVPEGIRQNLTALRENLLDEGRQNPKATLNAYKIGYQLCNNQIAILDEREQALVTAGFRKVQATTFTPATNQALEARRNYLMSWPQYFREGDQRADLKRVVEGNDNKHVEMALEKLKVEWSGRTTAFRKTLDSLYAQFREALRETGPAGAASQGVILPLQPAGISSQISGGDAGKKSAQKTNIDSERLRRDVNALAETEKAHRTMADEAAQRAKVEEKRFADALDKAEKSASVLETLESRRIESERSLQAAKAEEKAVLARIAAEKGMAVSQSRTRERESTQMPSTVEAASTDSRFAKVRLENLTLLPLRKGLPEGAKYPWMIIPEALDGYRYSSNRSATGAGAGSPTLRIKILSDGDVILACTSRFGGGGNGRDWKKELVTQAQLEQDGWKPIQFPQELKQATDYVWLVFSRGCKAGEELQYRTEKYVSPILLIP